MVYLVVSCFIVLDMVTGLIKALMNKEYTSTIMREGLFHKSGSILCILLGVLTDYAQTFLDLGVTIPVATSICVYISIMEIGSIIENIGVINPEIVPEKLKAFFVKLGGNDNGNS
jgi:toxin secretion/phage lysis holin